MEPILVILAAGVGSRYGGLKQIDTVGSNGESIIDFSIYDAYLAGFKKVVLIIQEQHKDAFENALGRKVRQFMDVEYCFQNIDDLPSGYENPEGRTKPWGTTHALLALRNQISEPFMIINADDYYGRDSFVKMREFLLKEVNDNVFAMMGYNLENTVSASGSVTRGVCKVENGYLNEIVEIKEIVKNGTNIEFKSNDKWVEISGDIACSMNYWGFNPSIFKLAQRNFETFLSKGIIDNPLKSEHVLPTLIGELLSSNEINVKVLATEDKWFGVTYKEDKKEVIDRLQEYKNKGFYPFDLWSK